MALHFARLDNLLQHKACNMVTSSLELIETPHRRLREVRGRKNAVVLSLTMLLGLVVSAVADTGAGIAQEKVDKIFDPFFTTKPPGKGTGLGLAAVLSMLREEGGGIPCDSRVGHGTRMVVDLPLPEKEMPK